MIIYPNINLRGGRCVNLIQGRIDEPVVFDGDPVETAVAYAQAGAEWLHVVDLDAVAGEGDNGEIIREIIRRANASVMVGGGISSAEQVREWWDAGAGRMVLGTAAVRSPQMVKELSYAFPDQIVVSVDVWQGKVVVNGWRESTAFEAADFVRQFAGWPLSQIIFTDIDRDLDLPDSSFALITGLAAQTATPVIASGLARSLDDISALKFLYNISGVIVGRALFEGTYTLEQALELAAAELGPIASIM